MDINFVPSIWTEIVIFFHKVWPWKKRKNFDVFSVIKLKGYADFLIEKFEEAIDFPRALVFAAKRFQKEFLKFHF